MIGGVNMNTKKRMVLLLSFFSFFMFIGEINAQEVTADISIGETRSNDQFNFTSCSASENGYLTTTITSSGGLKIGTSNTANPGTSDSVTCQYTEKSNIGAPETGEITFKLNIIGKREVRINLGMTSSSYEPSKDIAKEFLPSGSTITGYEVDPNGAEFINVGNCSGTTCNVSISQEAQNIAADGSSLSSIMYITYKIPGSNAEVKINAYLIINAVSGARAYAGGSGVCDFNSSDWRYRTWTDAGGSVYKFYQSYSDSATLPNCDSSNSKIPIEFKGWRETSDNDHVMAIGECSGALPAGSSVEDGKNYSACYERTPYVQISPATGNVDMTTGWTALKGNSGYYYASDSATTVTLPELKFVGIHENDELDYWYNSANPSEHKQSGDTVELDGSIWIAVVKTTISEGWKDLYKTVKVDQTVALVVDGITGCSSSSSKVNVNFIGGECQVSGVEATGDGEYADVITTVNGEEVIYKFNVEKVDASNVIIDDTIKTNLGTNSEVTNDQSWYTDRPESFMIVGDEGFVPYASGMTGTNYRVTEVDESAEKAVGYHAFCLDPGRHAPDGTLYVRAENIDEGHRLKKLVDVFLNQHSDFNELDDLSSTTRISFHVALRAVAIATGVTSALDASDRIYASNYEWYANIANHINDDNSSLKSFIDGLGFVGDAGDKLYNLLVAYKEQEDIEKEEFERTVTTTDTETYGDAGYKITYTGTIIAPTGVEVTSLDGSLCSNSGRGVNCSATISKNDTLTLERGKNVYDYVVTIIAPDASAVDAPDTDEEKRNTSFKVTYTGRYSSDDVLIAAPANGRSLQRMFVFNVNQPEVYVYFSIVPTSCDMPALDYKAHCDADSCDAEFNADLFMAAGCCRLVTDEVKYKYIIDNYCSGDGCTVSTMSSVCGLNSDNLGSAELYEIREGAKWENGGYVDQIGTCVVNVTQDYSVENLENFQKKDSAGNTLNVSSYSNNNYCQVSCGEDWKISLESFGNFVGENAVAAGTYFSTTNSDLFISGSRTCYTTYIDYDKYMRDLVEQSENAINAYNKYSEASHIWTDIDRQDTEDNKNISVTPTRVCIHNTDCPSKSGWTYDGFTNDENGEGVCHYSREVPNDCEEGVTSCGTHTETDEERVCNEWGYYYNAVLSDNDLVEDGTYISYTSQSGSNGTYNAADDDEVSYEFTENFGCTYNPPPKNGDASLSGCGFSGYATGDYSDGSDSSICGTGITKINGFCESANNFAAAEEAFDEMLPIVQEHAAGIMDVQSGMASQAVNLIHSYSQQMYNCQHFELYNTSDDDKEDANGVKYENNEISKGTYLDHSNVSYVKIDTQFNPHVTYEYDEPEFMTILGPDNVLVEYTKKNDEVWGGTYASATDESKDSQVNAYHSRNNSIPVDSSEVQLSRNDISTYYYNTSGKFTGDDVNTYGGDSGSETATTESKKLVFCTVNGSADTYSPSLSGDEWESGSCYQMDIEYVKAHYIKSSIANSSFYKNKGYWYLNASDLKEHGDNVEDALNKANKRDGVNYNVNEEIQNNRWYPYGTDNREEGVNIFPVSLDTPRNLYLYSYEFGDIGSYMDGKIGRLMGDEASLIQLNTRTCFYEVYEELCLCCGSTINSYVENYDTVNDYIQTHPDVSYTPSDSNAMNINENGVISFATSTVNLGDLNSDSERMLGNNWGTSQFLYSGNLYETSKGGELLTAIQSQGENVYSETPEYSYYLTPSTISAIRDYNDQYGYEVNYNNLRVYGSYAIRSLCDNDSTSDDCWEVNSKNDDENEYISFQHYGSSFLEDYMPELGAAYAGTLTENEINGSCFVTAGEANDYEKIKEKVNSGCRWVDYVQETDGKFFRLAFK